jgi:hypothetical protein
MLISYRIGMDHFHPPERVEELCVFLEQHRPAVDEITLFTEAVLGYHPLEFLEARLPIFERALRRFRELGWRAGLNVANTIGHLDGTVGHLDGVPDRLWEVPWQKMVGHDGTVARACSCPIDPAFLEDVRQRYRLLAALEPDFIWVDDDLRINYHPPVRYACFCPLCLADISHRLDQEFTRESLVEALSCETWPEPHPVRRAWDQRNHEAALGILRAVEEAAHEVAPGLELGLMMSLGEERVDQWLDALAGPEEAPVRLRPGTGWYVDNYPAGLFDKALSLGKITAHSRPERLASIQCEIENCPDHKLGKSVHLNLVESACYQATGCRGIAYNILPVGPNALDDCEARLAGIERWRPFFERLVEWGGQLPARGLWTASSSAYYRGGYFGGDWSQLEPYGPATRALRELGLPQAFRREDACAVVLAGGAISAFAPEEVMRLLAGGVIADAEAALWIERMGLGSLLGVHPEPIHPGGVLERMTDHSLNGDFGGRWHGSSLDFFLKDASVSRLEPLVPEVETLAELFFYYTEENLGASVTAFENELGGRVAVLGCAPWERAHDSATRAQLGRLAAWASRDTMPAWSALCHLLTVFARGGACGSPLLVTLVNSSADPSGDFPLRLTSTATAAWLSTPDQPEPVAVKLAADGDSHCTLTLPDLSAWGMCALRME